MLFSFFSNLQICLYAPIGCSCGDFHAVLGSVNIMALLVWGGDSFFKVAFKKSLDNRLSLGGIFPFQRKAICSMSLLPGVNGFSKVILFCFFLDYEGS